ncbi:MAG: adenylosuccinate synthetase [Nanoarchaeota archaeon]|nr:adenylosuccinate synthetase [Nanoarchaeota archaeon]
MGVDVIVGGQGGDEGKGKISAYLALKNNYDICMRVPAPQAGHSIHYNGKRVGLALLPCGLVNEGSRLLIGAGGLVSVDKLVDEIKAINLSPKRLGIDYKTTIVTKEHLEEEKANSHLMNNIGSVGRGIGPCRVQKIMRDLKLKFAKDVKELSDYLTDTKKEVYNALEKKKSILLEVDHGAKLDLIHGEYPYVTSRSTNASSALGEAGIGPRDVKEVYVVLKPYITRVGPGPLEKEILDEKVLNWAHSLGGETGTVSGRLRRVGKFEWANALEVMRMNSCTKIAITHMDCFEYIGKSLGYSNSGDFLEDVKTNLCSKYPHPEISLLSYGPEEKDVREFVREKIEENGLRNYSP